MDDQSLEHTRWNCKYHIVFAPKFRRKIIYGKYKKEIGVILPKLCEYKHLEILEAHAGPAASFCSRSLFLVVRLPELQVKMMGISALAGVRFIHGVPELLKVGCSGQPPQPPGSAH